MSISDLVPLVAAVLKDQAVTDENKELRQQLNDQIYERLLVQITGKGGTPVYYQASLKDGGTACADSLWMVGFEKKIDTNFGEDIIVPINLINELELRLGGHIFLFMRIALAKTDCCNDDIDEMVNEPQMGGIHFEENMMCCVHGKIGPILHSDYIDLDGSMEIPELIGFAENNGNQLQDLIITAVEFDKETFGDSIISLLERMGTSTTDVYDERWVDSVRSTGRPPSTNI